MNTLRPFHPVTLPVESPWLTLQEANTRLRFKSRGGIYKWLALHPTVPKVQRGKQWLVRRSHIDAALEPQSATLRAVK